MKSNNSTIPLDINTTKQVTVNSVNKAFQILGCFSVAQPELTLTQISSTLSYPKSTALNLIRTLEQCGYLFRTSNGQSYRLGYKILELSYVLRSSLPVVQYSLPFLEDLQEFTNEIIYLTSHINGQVLYLEGIYPSRRMANYSISGKTLPMHCTGCGKAMLAYLPLDEQRQVIQKYGLQRFTDYTITDELKLYDELEEIRKRGYSIDFQEESLGVKCIALPILNSDGYPTAAISISGTVINMKDELLNGYAEMLSRVCNSLSANANLFPAAQALL